MTAISITFDDSIATLTIDCPGEKVNTFSGAVMAELDQHLTSLVARKDLRGVIVISGKEGIFVAGADISEIRGISTEADALAKAQEGQRVFQKLADLACPSVAAIHGACLGGGCELALACTARVATDYEKTIIGLPEVSLGFVPGWGGTQRLPRLLGVSTALPLIVSGKPIDAAKAAKIGLVDRVCGKPFLLATAREVLLTLIAGGRSALVTARRPRTFTQKMLDGPFKMLVWSAARKQVMQATKGRMPAPLAAIEVVRTTVGGDLREGLPVEARNFAQLAVSPESRSLVGLFFASEAVKKDGGRPRGPALMRPAVLGAGVMGGGIAWLFAHKGLPVRIKDLTLEAVAKAYKTADDYSRQLVKRRKMTDSEARQVLARIGGGITWTGFKTCDVVVEAVVESVAVKRKVLAEVELEISDDCVLATNTSSLRVADIAQGLKRPQRLVGMHFFNPVNRMPLVEVVAGPASDEDAVARVADLARRCGKTAVVVRDCPGFLVNRILLPYLNEAARILQEGGDVVTIDRVMTAYGLPMGPFRLADEVGIDVGHKVAKILLEGYGDRMPVAEFLGTVHEDLKLLGVKGGAGFYLHPRDKKPQPNPTVRTALTAWRLAHSVTPRQIEAVEIRERCLLIMVNESARCIDEHIVATPALLDLAMVMGTGYPPEQGGPLRYADAYGISQIVQKLQAMAAQLGPRFTPAPLLERMASAGLTFHTSDLAAVRSAPAST